MSSTLESGVASRRIEIEVGGADPVELRYLEAGEGPPVVLLHGIGLDAAAVSWRYALPGLARDRRVLAPDFPGHGESDKPEREYTTEYFVSVLREFLDALDLDGASLVGTSMGGAVAMGHLLEGGRAAALVLASSHGLGRDAPWRIPGYFLLRTPFFDSVLGANLGANPATVAGGLASMAVDPDPEFVADVRRTVTDPAVARTLGSWQRDEFRPCGLKTCYLDRLDELDVPTLLIHGNQDPIFPVAWSERASERLPDGRLVPFESCGHWSSREHPERFNRVVGQFLGA